MGNSFSFVKYTLSITYGVQICLFLREMFGCLFGSRCAALKAPLRKKYVTYRPSFWAVLLTQELKGTSGISTELKFKRGEAKTMERREGGEKRKDWRNLMNIPSGSERGTIYRHQGLPAENSTEKWFQKLQKSEGICRQTEYASRPVHERVREQAVCMWVYFFQSASFHTEASPPI